MTDTALNGSQPPSCAEVETARELFVDGFFVKGWQCAMTGGDQSVLLLMSTMIFGGVGLALFISTGSLVIPAVLGILLAGIMFVALPATVTNLIAIALMLVISLGGLFVALRVRRSR